MILSDNETYTPPPCRSLYNADTGWAIPEAQRPPDWRERTAPKDIPAAKPKADWAAAMAAAPRKVGRPPKPKTVKVRVCGPVGRPKHSGRIHITPEEIARRLAKETMAQIAKEQGCNMSHISRLLRRVSGLDIKARPCRRCGGEKKRGLKALYCHACAAVCDSPEERRKRRAAARKAARS